MAETRSLVARNALDYNGQRVLAGQSFAAKADDAELLITLHLVDEDFPPAGESAPEPLTAASTMELEAPSKSLEQAPIDSPKPKRRYKRRDLEPEP
jgi:hypothetical protein